MRNAGCWLLVAFFACSAWASDLYKVGNRNQKQWHDSYLDEVQPLLTQRCAACHACFEAPCQLNLQSYTGAARGYNPIPIYSSKRTSYTTPTRLKDRPVGFHPVLEKDGLMQKFLSQSAANNAPNFDVKALLPIQNAWEDTDKHQCVATDAQRRAHFNTPENNKWNVATFDEFIGANRQAGMPFGLPRLEAAQHERLMKWIDGGAPGPSAKAQADLARPANAQTIEKWEKFLNHDAFKVQHTARYIYEHVFSAVISFDDNPAEFFELVRADVNGNEIVTELPYNDPKTRVYYRFKKLTHAMVQKTQNVWHLSDKKLAGLHELFIAPSWGVASLRAPRYDSNNMFEYFDMIPAQLRARFLHQNSRLIVGAMVQGAVCIGSRPTYAIADHFWGFMLKPESDPSVINPSLGMDSLRMLGTAPQPYQPKTLLGREALELADKLDLTELRLAKRVVKKLRQAMNLVRFNDISDESESFVAELVVQLKNYGLKGAEILGAIHHFLESADANQAYQAAFEKSLRRILKSQERSGLGLGDLWMGDGEADPNAWLNITRHGRSATVQYGPEGGDPQSIWILSYSNFERLYYNLVVHFKAWGSITHKLATWRHMSYVRLEGEDLAISVLPLEHRDKVREWFTRGVGGIKNQLFFPLHSTEDVYDPSRFALGRTHYPPRPHVSMNPDLNVKGNPRLTVKRYVEAIRKKFAANVANGTFGAALVTPEMEAFEASMNVLHNKSLGDDKEAFAQFIPNTVHLRVAGPGDQAWVYTILGNRAYKGHNLVFLENPNKDPMFDTVSVYRGTVGAYPEVFLDIPSASAQGLAAEIRAIKTQGDWEALRAKYAVARNSENFWVFFDWMHAWKAKPHAGNNPVEQGILDLNQYDIF